MKGRELGTPRQEELLEHALDIAREVGLAGLTVRKLAERIGFTEAALYRHFPHKQALLLAMIERLSEERLLGPLRAIAADRALTPRQKLAAVVRHHVTTVLAVDGLPVLVLAEAAAAGDEALLARFRIITAEIGVILDGLLAAAGVADGSRPSRAAIALTLFGVGAVSALHHRLWSDTELEREAREVLPGFVVERLLGPEPIPDQAVKPRTAATAKKRGVRK
jgi:AcrR family transcriptional regulator